MKTPMRNSGKFFKNQRWLAVPLLVATLNSCKKDAIVPPIESESESTMNELVSTKAIGDIIWQENADGSWFDNSYAKLQAAASYSITASTAQRYSGTRSVRFELRDTDPEVQSGTRAEITFPVSTNNNRWYSYAMYVPSADYKPDATDEVITQWHQGGGTTPALCLRTKDDKLWLRVMSETWIDLGQLDKDKWHTYVLHVKHTAGSDGLIEIWRDGVKILNRTGPNSYPINDTYHLPFWKFGIYKSYWNGTRTSSTNKRVLYFDDIKMGTENATYNLMAPTGSSTTPAAPDETTESNPITTTPTTGNTVSDLVLVNAETERDVLSIKNGQVISLKALGLTKVNIRANTSTTGSVKFELSGKQSKTYTDSKAPFALHGDDGSGNFYYGNWNPPALGTYTLKATPYQGDNATGTAGATQTVTFSIVQ
ncbi:polysaccharide lyase [Longitalea arenae]|uniref:polysaccharide lyase n=1 Tax=Longitalea arenae TaxID=2812558 RepID=UPI0019684FAF|nr:polysaccharide lyase [Longitalea arenae]